MTFVILKFNFPSVFGLLVTIDILFVFAAVKSNTKLLSSSVTVIVFKFSVFKFSSLLITRLYTFCPFTYMFKEASSPNISLNSDLLIVTVFT